MKKWSISFGAAALATWTMHWSANAPSAGPTLIDFIMMPFILLGSMASGNAHGPSEAVAYLSIFGASSAGVFLLLRYCERRR